MSVIHYILRLRSGHAYDPLYRLTKAEYSGLYTYTFAYAYDAVGHRLRYTQTLRAKPQGEAITNPVVTMYTYDAANRLTSVNGQAYTWDNNGNLKSDGSKTYTYDQANRLTGITAPGLTWSATYNGDGARRKQTVNGSVTTYTLDLAAPLVTVLTQQDAGGKKQYLYGLGDSPLASYDGAGWRYLSGRDGLNSVRQETDATGNVLAARSFDPYGVPLQGDGGAPFGYTGEMWDNATSLVFLRARMYQPRLGIFLSRDQWPSDRMRPQTLNGFSYVEGNVINRTDASGWFAGLPFGTCCDRKAPSAEERLQEIIREAQWNGVEALSRAFEDCELFEGWGDVAGRTCRGRLEWLLSVTSPDPSVAQIQHYFGEDYGFAMEFRDDQFYATEWKWWEHGTIGQVGHFLIAVDLTYYPWGREGLYCMIGHEMLGDNQADPRVQCLYGWWNRGWTVGAWFAALRFDEMGHSKERDDLLWMILAFDPQKVPSFGGVDPGRVGNSLQDLRLSLKGYRFAEWVQHNGSRDPLEAGSWLRWQLAHQAPRPGR